MLRAICILGLAATLVTTAACKDDYTPTGPDEEPRSLTAAPDGTFVSLTAPALEPATTREDGRQ